MVLLRKFLLRSNTFRRYLANYYLRLYLRERQERWHRYFVSGGTIR